uniref:HTH CENPB-type domain-containing protein n=1 Tax=Peronospora matthiolae TaxID=2874970 RepID=A0AAV1TN19_9STRA
MDSKKRKAFAPPAGRSSDAEHERLAASSHLSSAPGKVRGHEADGADGLSLVHVKKQRGANSPSRSSLNSIDSDVGSDSRTLLGMVLKEVPQVDDTVMKAEDPATRMSVEAVGTEAAAAVAVAAVDSRPRKGRRVRKTNLEKMEILAFVDRGGSQGAAAEKFGVSRTAVTKMVKERAAISAQALVENVTSSRKVLQYQHKLSVIEDMLHKWQLQTEVDAPALKITGELLQSKAMEFRNKILADYSSELSDDVIMSLTDFKASNGWLHRYMQRRSLRSLSRLQGQAGGDAMLTERLNFDQRIQKVRDLLLTVSPTCIWNLDEVVLRHRTTSARLDSIVNMDARSLEHISVAMVLSASGEKLYLQVVGKDPLPDSLKDVDPLTSYGAQYRDHCQAAHDAQAILDFIHAMNQEAVTRKQVWYLVLNSRTAHIAAAHALNPSGSFRNSFSFESIVLLFVPPGPSCDAQPLHQGILRSFKLRFRREMLQTLLREHEQWAEAIESGRKRHRPTTGDRSTVDDVFDVHAHTHMRNTLMWLHTAWESIPQSFIRQAWSASLYLPAVVPGDIEPSASMCDENDILIFTELLAQLEKVPALRSALGLDCTDDPGQFMMELLDFDKSETTGTDEVAKDDEIVVESLASQGLLGDTQRALVLESIKSDDPPLLTVSEANVTVSRLLHYIQDTNNLLTLPERRTGRTNLLMFQRLLVKARKREHERGTTTDFTV